MEGLRFNAQGCTFHLLSVFTVAASAEVSERHPNNLSAHPLKDPKSRSRNSGSSKEPLEA